MKNKKWAEEQNKDDHVHSGKCMYCDTFISTGDTAQPEWMTRYSKQVGSRQQILDMDDKSLLKEPLLEFYDKTESFIASLILDILDECEGAIPVELEIPTDDTVVKGLTNVKHTYAKVGYNKAIEEIRSALKIIREKYEK